MMGLQAGIGSFLSPRPMRQGGSPTSSADFRGTARRQFDTDLSGGTWSIFNPGRKVELDDQGNPIYDYTKSFEEAVGPRPKEPESGDFKELETYGINVSNYELAKNTWESMTPEEREREFMAVYSRNVSNVSKGDPANEVPSVGVIGDLPGGDTDGKPDPFVPITMRDIRVASNVGPNLENQMVDRLPTNPFNPPATPEKQFVLPQPIFIPFTGLPDQKTGMTLASDALIGGFAPTPNA